MIANVPTIVKTFFITIIFCILNIINANKMPKNQINFLLSIDMVVLGCRVQGARPQDRKPEDGG